MTDEATPDQQEQDGQSDRKEMTQTPTSNNSTVEPIRTDQIAIPSTSRAYSPIIEDPRERDSRPASVDPTERGGDIKLDDNMSLPSRAITPSSMPSRAATPSGESSAADVPASEPNRAVSPASDPFAVTTNAENNGPNDNNQTNAKQQSTETENNSEPKNEPIFKPLITEKGKSKTTGKNIGGWI